MVWFLLALVCLRNWTVSCSVEHYTAELASFDVIALSFFVFNIMNNPKMVITLPCPEVPPSGPGRTTALCRCSWCLVSMPHALSLLLQILHTLWNSRKWREEKQAMF